MLLSLMYNWLEIIVNIILLFFINQSSYFSHMFEIIVNIILLLLINQFAYFSHSARIFSLKNLRIRAPINIPYYRREASPTI